MLAPFQYPYWQQVHQEPVACLALVALAQLVASHRVPLEEAHLACKRPPSSLSISHLCRHGYVLDADGNGLRGRISWIDYTRRIYGYWLGAGYDRSSLVEARSETLGHSSRRCRKEQQHP